MRSIKYALLVFGLVLTAACEKPPAEPVAESAPPVTESTPAPVQDQAAAPVTAPMEESAPAIPPAMEKALDPQPVAAAACPTGCTSMRCPPPVGPLKCCKKTATGYQACL